jgi:diketogulonate reductase-like aldo/keto reductase
VTRALPACNPHGVIPPRVIQGVRVPALLYGTAWKEERTESLVGLALSAGFRGIDTANQRRHYVEAAVGDAVRGAKGLARGDLFLQTKFTHREGQDHRLPYDQGAEIAVQVRESFESSLEHLGTTYVDSYVLHGPSARRGLGPRDVGAWRAMEALHQGGNVRLLGVSNVSLEQLAALCDLAAVPPVFVQNRCYASTGWDRAIREFCADRSITYQAFSLLTANARELGRPEFRGIVERTGRTVAQVVFRFALQAGMLPLTGTSSEEHMREDLSVDDFELGSEDVSAIERLVA